MSSHVKPSQKSRLLEYLKAKGQQGATSIEIERELTILRYGARIHDLRTDGHEIACERVGTSEAGAAIFRYTLLPDFTGQLFDAPADTAHHRQEAA